MRRLDPRRFSKRFAVKELGEEDLPALETLCGTNPFYYERIGTKFSRADLLRDREQLPPGMEPESKYYVGFYSGGELLAVLDLIDGYPEPGIAYIGFFMVDGRRAGRGLGSAIVEELCDALREEGFQSVRLSYGVNNPQATRFWTKNGLQKQREVEHAYGRMIVAERKL